MCVCLMQNNIAKAGISPATINVLQAYCDGVNDYIQSGEPLSLEFRVLGIAREQIDAFAPVDIVQFSKVMSHDLRCVFGVSVREIPRDRESDAPA